MALSDRKWPSEEYLLDYILDELNTMPRPKPEATFRSYLDDDDGTASIVSVSTIDSSTVPHGFEIIPDDIEVTQEAVLEPRLLPGEVLISQARNVLKFVAYTERKQGMSGSLFVTNYKVTFVTYENVDNKELFTQRNHLVGEHDIPLCTIDTVYQVSSRGRKRLHPGQGIQGSVKSLELHCKDFRIHTFSFKFSPKADSKLVANAIVHHAFPTRQELLFAFEYKGNTDPENLPGMPPSYRTVDDWEKELSRLKAKGFRVTQINTGFRISESLPECFVVPSSLSNADITTAAPQFIYYRPPTWSYSHKNGAALLRMSELMPESSQKHVLTRMLKAVQVSHPKQLEPKVYELNKLMISIKDIQTSFENLRKLVMPVTLKDLWDSDLAWYPALEGTKWLTVVAECLRMALRVSDVISKDGQSVVLEESTGRDLSAVIASLVQCLLDPYSRTLRGFQSLIEREWVVMGHKFTDRCGLLAYSNTEQCPLFLLLLDCIWQLCEQFPSEFEFSEIYLIILWDSVCLGMFENFIYNSDRERMMSMRRFSMNTVAVAAGGGSDTAPKLMSVWDWSKQYDEQDRSLGMNPLYLTRNQLKLNFAKKPINNGTSPDLQKLYAKRLFNMYEPIANSNRVELRPVVSAPLMRFWSHCYLRWLTPIQIASGGTPLEYLQQCILVEEILCLQHQKESLENSTPFNKAERRKSQLIFSYSTPYSKTHSELLTSSFPYSSGSLPSYVSCIGTPLSLFLENSLIVDCGSDSTLNGGEELDEVNGSNVKKQEH